MGPLMVRILVSAGIGDIYWVLVKLRAFCRSKGITGKPFISILADPASEGHLRSLPLLEMTPFVEVGKPAFVPLDPVKPRPEHIQEIYREAFNECGRTAYPGLYGHDYFICYNGVINSGHWLDDCDGLECEWDLGIVTDGKEWVGSHLVEKHGKYMALYLTFNGNYIKYQLNQFPLDELAESIRRLSIRLDLIPVFIGAWWDLQYNDILSQLMSMVPGSINIIGRTSLDQALDVMDNSEMIIGYHSGLTNLGLARGNKTVLLWPSSLPFGHRMPASVPLAVAPSWTRNTTYRPVFTGGLTVDRLVGVTTELLEAP